MVSCYCRYCSYCEASVFGQHGCTRISTLHGFNTVVVGLLQFAVMNKHFLLNQCFVMASFFSSLDDWVNISTSLFI